jgi:hypothetical protein
MMDRAIEELGDVSRVEHRSNSIEGRRLLAMLEPDVPD